MTLARCGRANVSTKVSNDIRESVSISASVAILAKFNATTTYENAIQLCVLCGLIDDFF